jgi:tRNA(Ile)-lysidine synthase TilS/MesJ
MAYSGGKDSSYTLKILKEDFNLNVLAITFNNGFVSDQARKNIASVTESLNIDHLMVSPGFRFLSHAFNQSITKKLYPLKSLVRASSICNTCISLVKSILLKTAIEMNVPFITYGWSPGQAPIQSSVLGLNKSMIKQMQTGVIKTLWEVMGNDLNPYILDEWHYKLIDIRHTNVDKDLLYNIHPLAFYEYDEETILKAIKAYGWEEPRDTDANSTNCLLNSFANLIHQDEFGFHPYAFEIAGLVRNGYITREQGLEKLSAPVSDHVISYVKQKLRIK